MTPPRGSASSSAPDPTSRPPSEEEATPGLPGFKTWRGVYVFVIGCFVAYVVLLTLFTHAYSR